MYSCNTCGRLTTWDLWRNSQGVVVAYCSDHWENHFTASPRERFKKNEPEVPRQTVSETGGVRRPGYVWDEVLGWTPCSKPGNIS